MQKALVIIGVIVGLGLFSYADGWRHLEGLFNAVGFVFVSAVIAYGCWLGVQHFIINKINRTNNESIKAKKNSSKKDDFKDYQG